MFITPRYIVTDLGTLFDHIERHYFATLYPHSLVDDSAPMAPLVLKREEGTNGTLYGHLPKRNPHSTSVYNRDKVLVKFDGPKVGISGNWYLKQNAVPTVNFIVVQATGRFVPIDDRQSKLEIVSNTVTHHERAIEALERTGSVLWGVDRLTAEYRGGLLDEIVGFKIPIETIRGYFKLDQGQPIEDQRSVIEHLRRLGSDDAREIADLMQKNLEERLRGPT